MNNRIVGSVILLFSVFYGLTAFTFKLTFIADPLGPSKYPILLSLFSLILSLYLIISPGNLALEYKFNVINRPISIFVISLFSYIFLLWLLGYVFATIIYMTLLGLIFGGKLFKSFITSIIFSLTIYLFFVSLLKLHLPTCYIIEILK
jgi:putative tricarboxylic transport membrane protein